MNLLVTRRPFSLCCLIRLARYLDLVQAGGEMLSMLKLHSWHEKFRGLVRIIMINSPPLRLKGHIWSNKVRRDPLSARGRNVLVTRFQVNVMWAIARLVPSTFWVRILVQDTIYRRRLIGRYLDESEAYDISELVREYRPSELILTKYISVYWMGWPLLLCVWVGGAKIVFQIQISVGLAYSFTSCSQTPWAGPLCFNTIPVYK